MQNPDFFTFTSFALSVTDVNRQVKSLLESDPVLEDVSVEGELSNISQPASGHIYFSLKDDKSSLKCVMWRTNASAFMELFQNGLAVIVHGRIGVYERDGAYQLYADALYPVGQGKLFEEFLKLKDKLEKEGLFDPERKKLLPALPSKIGIVTSASGAALQDMLNTIRKRWPVAEILLSPAAVQGVEAPAELRKAFIRLEALQPDVILIGRGGGSLEDLWAFNDERLTRLIADSSVPVISGIGHETDFTLVDFAADYRAPTPTGAAVAATPDRYEMIQVVDGWTLRMNDGLQLKLQRAAEKLETVSHRLDLAAPLNQIRQEKMVLEQLIIRLGLWSERNFQQENQSLQNMIQRLESSGPDSILKRGYALIEDKNGKLIASVSGLVSDQTVKIRFHDGSKEAKIE